MTQLDAIRNYWDLRSEGYCRQIQKEQETGEEVLYRRYFEPLAGKRVLDVGCGPGYFSVLLAHLDCRVTALDYSEKMLEKAETYAREQQAAGITFVQGDAQIMPFSAESFDAVVSRNLVWNLEAPEKAYREWLRVLRPEGDLLVFDGNFYRYLFDAAYAGSEQRPSQHILLGVSTEPMEKIARVLPLSAAHRPEWDCDCLSSLGAQVAALEITEVLAVEGRALPMRFVLHGKKQKRVR